MLQVVVLMVLLGVPEDRERLERDARGPAGLLLQPPDARLGERPLLLRAVVDGKRVRTAAVDELAPGVEGVHVLEKYIQELIIRHPAGVVLDHDRLPVARFLGLHVLVGGVRLLPSGIAAHRLFGAGVPEHRRHAPEASAGEIRFHHCSFSFSVLLPARGFRNRICP